MSKQLNSNLTSTSFDEMIIDPLSRKAMSSILLKLSDPILLRIVDAIRPIIHELIITERKTLINGLEIMTIAQASSITSVPINTIYSWIANGVIENFSIANKNHVSLTQIKHIMKTKSYSSKSKSSVPIEDS